MSNFNFRKAEKKSAVLKLAFMGVAGSGKTYSALKIATAITDPQKVVVIDTERSVDKYADIFPVNVCEWNLVSNQNQIDLLIEAIKEAEKQFKVIVIDSLSFFWSWLIEYVDNLTKTRFNGNSFMGWGVGTPLQKKLIQTILLSPSHIIVTFRAKTEWIVNQEGGRTKISRAGLGAEQGKQIEYEFDLLGVLTEEHLCDFRKDRFGKFQDRITKIDDKFCKELRDWLCGKQNENDKIIIKTVKNIQKTNKEEKTNNIDINIEKRIIEIENLIKEFGELEYIVKFNKVKEEFKKMSKEEIIKKLEEIENFLKERR